MFSYFEPNFNEKFIWQSGFWNFRQNRHKIKIGYLTAILKQYNILKFLLQNYDFFIVHYGANFIAKFRWKSIFLRLGP